MGKLSDKDLREIIGANIRSLREQSMISQEKLASILNLSRATLSGYENGERSPDIITMFHITEHFNTNLDYIIGRTNIRDTVEQYEEDFLRELNLVSFYGLEPSKDMGKITDSAIRLIAQKFGFTISPGLGNWMGRILLYNKNTNQYYDFDNDYEEFNEFILSFVKFLLYELEEKLEKLEE